jgi:hypothetical protein
MHEDNPPPCDFGWFTPHQYEALLRVVGQHNGMATIADLVRTVRARAAECDRCQLTAGHTIRVVMRQTRAGFPGVQYADLVPITRGILTAIFEEQPV